MDFFKLDKYVHSYIFPYYDFLLENKSYFDEYYELKKPYFPTEVNNASLGEGEIYQFLDQWFLSIIFKYYVVSPVSNRSCIGIYKQTDTSSVKAIHNHALSSTITTVLYIDPPKPEEGGGITFHLEAFDDTMTINPVPGHAYFFPSWLYHTPEPQTTPTTRISLNWGYMSYTRPVHKLTGDFW